MLLNVCVIMLPTIVEHINTLYSFVANYIITLEGGTPVASDVVNQSDPWGFVCQVSASEAQKEVKDRKLKGITTQCYFLACEVN